MSKEINKKRDLLPLLHECIITLSNMSGEVASLEINDNDVRSRKLKRDLARFENGPYKKYKDEILNVRSIINNKPKKTKNHESESEKLRRSECTEQQQTVEAASSGERGESEVSYDAGGLF